MNGKKEDMLMFVFIASFWVAVWFLCAGRNAVHDLRERVAPVRTELSNARKEQQEQSKTLREAERTTGEIRERIEDSKRFNQEITDTERENAEIIAECRNILKTVRERGGAQN